MKSLSIGDLQTTYYVAGNGPRDILFLHGWAASGRMWLRSMWALRRQYRLWAIDLPGFGDSDSPEVDWYSIENYTEHVVAFCQAVGLHPYTVVGHSMGGRIAFELARRFPDLAERLVAISPTITGRLGFNLDLLLVNGLGPALMNVSRHLWPVATAGSMSLYWAPRYLGSEGMKRTTNDLRRSSWEASIGSLRAVVGQDYTPYLAEIAQPTLLICGKQDYTVPPDDSKLASRYLPDARLLVLPHVHHQPTDEAAQIYMQALQTFMQNGHVKAVA